MSLNDEADSEKGSINRLNSTSKLEMKFGRSVNVKSNLRFVPRIIVLPSGNILRKHEL